MSKPVPPPRPAPRQPQQNRAPEPPKPSPFPAWFHGVITRGEAESRLQYRPIGCFLIRLNNNNFYTLSFRAEDRCRHYIIDQTPGGQYTIFNEAHMHSTLEDLVGFYRENTISNWSQPLGEPCDLEDLMYDDSALPPDEPADESDSDDEYDDVSNMNQVYEDYVQ